MMKNLVWIFCVGLLAMGSSVYAANYYWFGGSAGDSWGAAQNWKIPTSDPENPWSDATSAPGYMDVAYILSLDGQTTATVDQTGYEVFQLQLGVNWNPNPAKVLIQAGGELTVATTVGMGWDQGVGCELTVDGGTWNVDGQIYIGDRSATAQLDPSAAKECLLVINSGTLNADSLFLNTNNAFNGQVEMYSGNINLDTILYFDRGGTMTLYGGTVKAKQLGNVPQSLPVIPVIDFRGGTLLLEGDWMVINGNINLMDDLRDGGYFIAYGGANEVLADYNITTPGYTTVRAGAGVGYNCFNQPSADFDGDCRVTLVDFAEMASEWLKCNRVPADTCP